MVNDPVRILLVDDEEELLIPLKKNLELKGYRVVTATGGILAWAFFNKLELDVVITDVNMPEGDGIDLVKKIKGQDPSFPILCFMTDISVFSSEDVYKLGVEALLSKPFDFKELCERIAWIRKGCGYPSERISYSDDLIHIEGLGEVEHGRGGISFVYKQQSLPQLGSLCRFNISTNEQEQYAGVGWLRWLNSETSRIGLEIVSLSKGAEVREKYLDEKSSFVYIP